MRERGFDASKQDNNKKNENEKIKKMNELVDLIKGKGVNKRIIDTRES